MARVLVGMGINKVRLTGGEPLLRKGVVEFVRELAKLRPQGLEPTSSSDANCTAEAMPSPFVPASFPDQKMEQQRRDFSEPLDIALTTNGHMLADLAQPLKDAGLTRVTVSMDAVDPVRFARITRVPNGYDHVLAGIRAARRAGGGVIPAANVTLTGKGVTKTAQTQVDGSYVFPGLAPGQYTVKVAFPGFAPINKAVNVTAGGNLVVPIQLVLASEKQEITVADQTTTAVSVEPDNNATALVLRGEDLAALPDDPDDLSDRKSTR